MLELQTSITTKIMKMKMYPSISKKRDFTDPAFVILILNFS